MGTEPRRRSTADAAATRAGSSPDRPPKRPRSKPVDGRTRAARRWKALHARYLALAGVQHDELVRALCTLLVRRERMDLAAQRGESVDPLHLVRVSGEVRRVMERLNLIGDGAPGEDGTAAALAALRADRGEARPA